MPSRPLGSFLLVDLPSSGSPVADVGFSKRCVDRYNASLRRCHSESSRRGTDLIGRAASLQGKFHLLSNSAATCLHLASVGGGSSEGPMMFHMAWQTSGMAMETVESSRRKYLATSCCDMPVASYLQKHTHTRKYIRSRMILFCIQQGKQTGQCNRREWENLQPGRQIAMCRNKEMQVSIYIYSDMQIQ